MDEKVQVRHPEKGTWLAATIVHSQGGKVTVKFTQSGEILTVESRKVRPVNKKAS